VTDAQIKSVRPPSLAGAARQGLIAGRFWRLLPAGMRRRWWLFRPFDFLARLWPTGRKHGLLVVRMDGIGDMVLFRAALDKYAEAFGVTPGDITVLGCRSWEPIADAIFAGYRVIAIDEHAYARRPIYRFKINLMVRRLAPAVAVCDSYFRRALMADSLIWVSGANRKVVSVPYANEATRAEYTWYMSQVDDAVDTGPYPCHECERHARFLSVVTGRNIQAEPPSLEWRDRAPNIASGAPYIVLNPGSNEYGRRWPFDSYAAVARQLLLRGFRVAVVGSASESPPANTWDGLRAEAAVIDLIGATRLPELLDVLKGAAGVITNDTGPAHLAIALGTPTVVIVGGGHFGSFVPYPAAASPPNARFVWKHMDCYHCFWRCHLRKDEHDSFPCVASVTENQVIEALDSAMNANHAPTSVAQ
jgi:ADP-heptose:LPS heptosyltransferase